MRDRILAWLGIESRIAKLEERTEEIATQFVTKRDPQTQVIVETLADRYADEDGKPRPKRKGHSRPSWDMKRRQLEAQNSEPRKKAQPVQ